VALTPGSDGFSALRAIIEGAQRHLVPGGALYLEHGYDQAHACRTLMRANGYTDVASYRDPAGIERVSAGRRARLTLESQKSYTHS
jgi:release factor glutamine methyltransferase